MSGGSRPPRDDAARRRAVAETSASVVVTAGAGTGKTSLIVERLLVTLGSGALPLSAIAAITFTEKAAGELRDRLASGLEALGALAEEGPAGPPSEAARALRALAAAGHPPLSIARHAQAAIASLDRAVVTTIHGFCADILRAHPIEAGLPPGFRVDRGPASSRIAAEEWEAFVKEELGPAAPREALWAPLLAASGIGPLEELGRRLASGGVPWRWLREEDDPAETPSPLAPLAARLAGDLREAERATPGLTRAPREWLDEAIGALDALARSGPDDLRSAYAASSRLAGSAPSVRTAKVADDEAARLESLIREARRLIGVAREVDDGAVRDAVAALRPFARRLRERLTRAGLVDFDTLLVATRDLLRDRLEVRDALKRRYHAILVDEFQDTDPLQYEIVFLLAERDDESASDPWAARPAPGRLFIVGDAKQSIYRFRGADYAAYRRAVTRVLEEGGLALELTANFRSGSGIVAAVNRLFDAPGSGWRASPEMPAYERISAERDGGPEPAVEVWTTPDSARDASTRRRAEGRVLAAAISRLAADGHGYGDVLVLLRSFGDVSIYLRAFREAGIPFVASGGRTFYERTEIGQALAVLRAVARPDDPIARLAFFRSGAGGVPDSELDRHAADRAGLGLGDGADPSTTPRLAAAVAHLDAMARAAADVPVDAAVRFVLERSGLLAVNASGFEGAQRVANLEKLAADAAEYARDGSLSLVELLDALDERPRGQDEGEGPLADEGADAVRVMTVHAAKGLEAPIVVLADAAGGRRSDRRETEWTVRFARGAGGDAVAIAGPGLRNGVAALAALADARHEAAEDLRLLYVALTRARDRLVVLAGPGNGPAPWIDALAAWAYDAKSPPPDGAPLSEGEVVFRALEPAEVRSPERAGVAAGAPGARTRYLDATRAAREGARAFLSPSALAAADGGTGDGGDAEHAREVGARVHAILERGAGEADRPDPDTAEILASLGSSGLAARLARLDVLGREVPMLFREEDGALWRGAIDLLYREADGTLVVADYKTDARLEGAVDRHRAQLRVYAAAVRHGRRGPRVRAELWMLRHGAVLPVDV